jgi:ankyrin repeat protein
MMMQILWAALLVFALKQKEKDMTQEFLSAVTQGDALRVKEMLSKEPSLAQVRDDRGVSAILKATYYGKKDVLAVLLASGAELNVFEAAATGQTDRVRLFISANTGLVNAFSSDGFTPLGLAVFFGHRDATEALLAAGAEVNLASRESMKVTPLQSAAAGRRLEIARLLIDHGANVNASQPDMGFTALHEAASNGDIEFAKLLLDHGADINAKMTDGKTPLAFALERKQEEMESFMSSRGCKDL